MQIIKVFSTPNCSHCFAAKLALTKAKIPFESINLESCPEEMDRLNITSAPTLIKFVDGVETFRCSWPISKDQLEELR